MKKRTPKQIIALLAVVLLVAMYVVTFILALLDPAVAGKAFMASMICTLIVPLFAWIFIWIFGQYSGKKTIADLNLMQDPEDTAADSE